MPILLRREPSAQNNSRPSVNFRPNYQNDLAKQLIVGHNDLTIGLNGLRGQCSGLYMHYYIVSILPHVKFLLCTVKNWKMVCQSVWAWHFGYFVHWNHALPTCTCTYMYFPSIHMYCCMSLTSFLSQFLCSLTSAMFCRHPTHDSTGWHTRHREKLITLQLDKLIDT